MNSLPHCMFDRGGAREGEGSELWMLGSGLGQECVWRVAQPSGGGLGAGSVVSDAKTEKSHRRVDSVTYQVSYIIRK